MTGNAATALNLQCSTAEEGGKKSFAVSAEIYGNYSYRTFTEEVFKSEDSEEAALELLKARLDDHRAQREAKGPFFVRAGGTNYE